MSYISANNIDRKLMSVSMCMFSGSRNPNMAIILCQLLFFNMDATFYVLIGPITLFKYCSAKQSHMRFFDSAVLYD